MNEYNIWNEIAADSQKLDALQWRISLARRMANDNAEPFIL